jgi:hypothetical protein
MPRFCKPDVKYKIVLDEDQDVEPQPYFVCRSVSMDQHWKIAETIDRQNVDTVEQYFNSNVEALLLVLIGWENIVDPSTNEEVKFSEAAIRKVLTAREVMELLRKALFNDAVTLDEKKS